MRSCCYTERYGDGLLVMERGSYEALEVGGRTLGMPNAVSRQWRRGYPESDEAVGQPGG